MCVRIIFMGCVTDGCLYLVTILMGYRESLVGVGLIVNPHVLLHGRRLCMSLIESLGGVCEIQSLTFTSFLYVPVYFFLIIPSLV